MEVVDCDSVDFAYFFARVSQQLDFFQFEAFGITDVPGLRYAEHVFDFFSTSARMFVHRNIAASLYIQFIPGCPKCKELSAASRSGFGTITRSGRLPL